MRVQAIPVGRGGCTEPGCETNATSTVDAVHGRRCAAHPPRFDPARAVRLAVNGLIRDALAYARTEMPA